MKIFFSLLLTFGMATPALAQGKVRLVNDSLHLVYWEPGGPGGGQPYFVGDRGITLVIELWAGTSSTALGLVATTGFGGQAGAAGTWAGLNVTLPTAAGPTFFDIYIYDAAAGNYWGTMTNFPPRYHGTSGLFTTVSSGTIAYNSLVNHNSPASSTWANGTWNLDSVSPGFRGAIELTITPEPSNFALACLGFALLVLRRRAEAPKDSKLA